VAEPWRMAGCECPEDAKPRERCNRQWTRCNERLRYLRPNIPDLKIDPASVDPADAGPGPSGFRAPSDAAAKPEAGR
jgi:hypothetical protein